MSQDLEPRRGLAGQTWERAPSEAGPRVQSCAGETARKSVWLMRSEWGKKKNTQET